MFSEDTVRAPAFLKAQAIMEMKHCTERCLSIFNIYIKEAIRFKKITNSKVFSVPQDNAENTFSVLELFFSF